jgi:hypothetical protein
MTNFSSDVIPAPRAELASATAVMLRFPKLIAVIPRPVRHENVTPLLSGLYTTFGQGSATNAGFSRIYAGYFVGVSGAATIGPSRPS